MSHYQAIFTAYEDLDVSSHQHNMIIQMYIQVILNSVCIDKSKYKNWKEMEKDWVSQYN